MTEYALLVDNVFKEIRNYEEKPQNIPHKKVTWHNVVRQYGSAPSETLVNGNWVIQTIDPSTLPPSVPTSVTARQVRLLLLQNNLLDDVEALIQTQDQSVKIQWEYATQFERNDPLLNQMAETLNISQEELDQFFIDASAL